MKRLTKQRSQGWRINMSENLKPVLIAGAGPTGMMAAIELSRFDIPVRLVEKKAEPETTSRAIGVQARTLELLEQRGLGPALANLGNPGLAFSLYGDGKRIWRLEFERISSKYNYLLFVSQAETENVLRQALDKAGVTIERNLTFLALSQADLDTKLTAVLQHKDGSLERFECSYLIDAEGAHSNARGTVGLHFEGKTHVEDYALGDLHIDGELVETDFHIFSSEHGFMSMFPMGGRRFRVMADNPINSQSKGTGPSLEQLQEIYDQRSHIPAKLRDMSWSSWFRINSRMVNRLQVGRVFLGGDAAHIHSPAGAQGMNTGMQDMINLCWKLAMVMKRQAKPELLETYSKERIPIIQTVLKKTEAVNNAIASESRLFRSVFNHIAPWLVGMENVQDNAAEHMSQLALNYRESPLAGSSRHSGGLRAGDRLPDLPVTLLHSEGSSEQQPRPATIFSLLSPSCFTLLYCNIPDPAKTHSEVQSAIGPWHHMMRGHLIAANPDHDRFKKHFGASPLIILVRPDGYVAFTGSDNSIGQLAKFCGTWLVPQTSPVKVENAYA
jgi:2-polyprenyl-6-methoxyphenol hydroxylase-like FAD-dependent oxidoreductase